jgi:quinol monooxygenase YgiN
LDLNEEVITLILNLMRIDAMPRKRQELEQTLLSMADEVRKTKGCLGYHFYQDLEREDTLCLVQEWESQRDFDAYLASDLFSVLHGATTLLSHSHRQISFSNVS